LSTRSVGSSKIYFKTLCLKLRNLRPALNTASML
jgi:hypothetical protein